MDNNKPKVRSGHVLAASAAVSLLMSGAALMARQGRDEPADRTDSAVERATRDVTRAQDDAAKNQDRYAEERAKIMEDAAKDPQSAAKELAELEEDIREDTAKAVEDAAKDAEDFAEELAKSNDDDHRGSSSEMRDIGKSENPEYDSRGFPVRRSEIVALDLKQDALTKAHAQGFRVIEQENLPALGAIVTRMTVPKGMEADDALRLMQEIEPGGTFDFTHYYGLQFAPSGAVVGSGKDVLPRKKDRLTIGMIDTGVMSHPAMKGVSVKYRDFGNGAGTAPVAHGTAVASILVSEGSNHLYVASIFRGGTAAPFTSADALVSALEWMVDNKISVVNVSLSGPRNAILDKLVERSAAKGVIIVAAAGNGGPTAPPAYPAALRSVIAVTAVDANRRVYRYANQGRYITVAARGVNEPAAETTGGIGRFSGTSFATPHVAAWMARCRRSLSSLACATDLRKSAIDLGVPGHDPVYGHGLIE